MPNTQMNHTNTHVFNALTTVIENIESGATLARDFWEDFSQEIKDTSVDRRYTVKPRASSGYRSGIFTYRYVKYYYYALNGRVELKRI